MNYEQKYNASLEQAKKELASCGSMDCDAARLIFRLFPQLRESEDERIRVRLIQVVSAIAGGWPFETYGITKKEAIAYLEKQKEKLEKPIIPEKENEVMKAIECAICVYGKTQGEWIAGYDMDTLVVHLRKAFAALKKQKESLHISKTCKENADSFTDEDEMIKKELIEFIKWSVDRHFMREDFHQAKRPSEWIAYLEKQKTLSELGKYIAAERTKPGFMFAGNDSVSWEELPLDVRKHDYPYYFIGDLDCYPFDVEKQKEQDSEDEEDSDFTIYHPLKNGKGEYECIPYSFYGSLTSFSEDKDLIDFLRTCFYTEEECNEWIEKQKEQKSTNIEREYIEERLRGLIDKEGEYYRGAREELAHLFYILGGQPSQYLINNVTKKEQKPISFNTPYNPDDYEVVMEGDAISLKRKEQKPDIELIQRSWYMEGYTDGEFKREPMWNLVTGKGGPRYEKNEKYGQPLEQKPAEWDDYTKTNLGRAIQIIKNAKGNLQGYQTDDGIYECDKAIECLEHFLYRGLEIEKPAEWSEEDELMRTAVIQTLERFGGRGTTEMQISWLKSLRPSWKPSEEQLEAARYVSQFDYGGHKAALVSLYEQLKAL